MKMDIYPTLCTGRPRQCGLCKALLVMTEDGPKQRLYTCNSCEAVEVVTKGGTSWWYHGCVRPDGTARDGDGRVTQGGNFGWWRRAG